MRASRLVLVLATVVCLIRVVCVASSASDLSAPPILPKEFAGWQIQGAAQASKDAAAADPTNAAVLKEYGFTDVESATYKSDDGRTLKIRAARFVDASGAFGAYSFYLQPEMARETIGDQGASLGPRVLFYRGHIVVDAAFSQLSVMSAAGLRELAGRRVQRECRELASHPRLHAASWLSVKHREVCGRAAGCDGDKLSVARRVD